MILRVEGAGGAGEQMRRDADLLAAAEAGAEPVLRLFGFAPPGITLGLLQDAARELDRGRCLEDGIEWAVRPTGGRAIFHDQEWTYAFAAPLESEEGQGTAAEAYDRVSAWIAASLRRLGVPAELARRDGGGDEGPENGPVSAPCFASTARHEILLAGRKLVGSAQRRTRQALLQQGSVLLGPSHLRLADYLPLPEDRRAAWRETLRRSTADAGGYLAPEASLEDWAQALLSVLPPGVRRENVAPGGSRLTVPNGHSYTSSVFGASSGTG